MEVECFVQPSRVNDWWDLSSFANFSAMLLQNTCLQWFQELYKYSSVWKICL